MVSVEKQRRGEMTIELKPAIAPAYLKAGFFGGTGTGKTFTTAKLLAQFIRQYTPESQLAMFDTEPSAGYIAGMVKEVSGKELLAFSSRSFSDLIDFTNECIAKKHVVLIDSITHPWRSLCNDYLEAKRSRVESAGGNIQTVKLSLKDWGPIKDMWNKFSELFVYSPLHIVILGREGDVWESVTDEEGKEEMKKTGVKMKTESELGYEPSLLVQMRLEDTRHIAFVAKDRFNILTGITSKNNPDIEFFKPHIEMLNLGGKGQQKNAGKPIFEKGQGANWETIKAQREAILESIKDDLVLAFPGRSDEMQKAKILMIRKVFGKDASWSALEGDDKKYPIDALKDGREKMQKEFSPVTSTLKEKNNGKNNK
jgi:hypothetical protein